MGFYDIFDPAEAKRILRDARVSPKPFANWPQPSIRVLESKHAIAGQILPQATEK